MIQARIRKGFAGTPDRSGISLDVEFGCECGTIAVFGPHGAGKSALLEALTGLLKPDEGRILVDDRILYDAATGVNLPPRSRPCAYLPPDGALFPHLTVRENLLFAAGCRTLARLERHRTVTELLERFELSGAAQRLPADLPPLERQRGVIARALAGKPKLLLLDDPARGLDTPLRLELYDLLRRVNQEWGVAIVAATGNAEECFELGEQLLVLVGGRLVQSGPPRQVIDQPANLDVARALGGFNLLPVEITALDPGRNSSRVRLGDAELSGPYYPGRFRGDRVTLCVRPIELSALAGVARPGPNQVAARLARVIEFPQTVRLMFDSGVAVEMARPEYERCRHRREWVVEFPAERLRIL